MGLGRRARLGYLVSPAVLTYTKAGFTQARFGGTNLVDAFTGAGAVTLPRVSPPTATSSAVVSKPNLHRAGSGAASIGMLLWLA